MTATSTTEKPADAKPPVCERRHCDTGDCDPCYLDHVEDDDLGRRMAAAWLAHWPVGHPERLTDWRRTHLQPWRLVAEHLEATGR